MKKRVQRVNELIKRELGKILLTEIELPKGTLATLTRVETSPDLNHAKVFISCLPKSQAANTLKIVNKEIYHLQQKLNKRLKMKFVPKIGFWEEKETERAGKIEEILEMVKNEKSPKQGKQKN